VHEEGDKLDMVKRNKKPKIYLLGVTILAQVITGCSLLPKEEGEKNVLMVHTQENVEYQLALVQQADIVNSETMYCTYSQRDGEELSFGQDKLEVKAVYVAVGDQVNKGDLLAEAKLDGIDDQINELDYSIEELDLKIESRKRLHRLKLELLSIQYKNQIIDQATYEAELAKEKQVHQLELGSYEDELYLTQLKQTEAMKKRDEGRIYAGMDGIVSYVYAGLLSGPTSVSQTVMTLMDKSQCAFKATSKNAKNYEEGESVQLELSEGSSIETTVVHSKTEEDVVYFQLLYPDFELSVGERATTELILEQKKDVLVIPTEALRKTQDSYYVYMQNADGMKVMQPITIGISGNGITEVTSGLEDQDIIIIK
jgi:multidrug efflux pump subunit AcrA (membrane-fusion protein)